MKTVILVPKIVDVGYIMVQAVFPKLEQGEELPDIPGVTSVNGTPIWNPMINVDSGKIMGWRSGEAVNIDHDITHIKTSVIDQRGELLHETEELPEMFAPNSGAFALEMSIDTDGRIKGWDNKSIVNLLKEAY